MVNSAVGPSFVLMYANCIAKCGSIGDARLVFDEITVKDVVAWTALVTGCGSVGDSYASFSEVVDKDIISWASIIFVNAGFGFMKIDHEEESFVRSAGSWTLSMYCKFRFLSTTEKLFRVIPNNYSQSWNIMVHGYCKMGQEAKAIELFRKLQQLGFEVDSNSMVSVIFSFSHLGQSVLVAHFIVGWLKVKWPTTFRLLILS
ncbi:hypothetical protein V6N13_086614 [Hibiscus sabdariffa]